LVAALRVPERALGRVLEQHAVGQAGEVVVRRLVTHLLEQPRVLERGRGLVGDRAAAVEDALDVARHDVAEPRDRDTEHRVVASDRDRGHRVDLEHPEHLPGELRLGRRVDDRRARRLHPVGDEAVGVVAHDERPQELALLARPAVIAAHHEALVLGIAEEHERAVGVEHRRHGLGDLLRDLRRLRQDREPPRELEQRGRGRAALARLVERGGGVERGRRTARVRSEQPPFVVEELVAVVERGEAAVVTAGRHDVDHDA
jgi:hypothetical protein